MTPAPTKGTKELGKKAPPPAAEASPAINVYVLSAAELPKDISFEFNARSPSRSSRAYKSMRETLKDMPERFIELNGGIALANGRYVLDGGHTVTAIMDAIKEDGLDARRVHVSVRDYGNLSNEEMERRSAALNRRVTPPMMGEKDLEGAWEPIKNVLDKKYADLVEFRPNTKPGAVMNVGFLVALLNAWTETRAHNSYSGKGNLIRLFKGEKYERLLPLLNTAIEFWCYVYKALLEEKQVKKIESVKLESDVTLPNGERIKGDIPESLIWPTFAAFSVFINGEGDLTADLEEEFQSRKTALVKQLMADFKKSGLNPSKYGKSPDSYVNSIVALRSAD